MAQNWNYCSGMLPRTLKLAQFSAAFAFGTALALTWMSSPASAEEIKTLINKINSPNIPTDGQIWIEESSATLPFHKCGTPEADIGPRLFHAVTAVVATQDGKIVRLVLGRCEDWIHSCLSINSTDSTSEFQTWSSQSLDNGQPAKKDISIDLQGERYILHDVVPLSKRIDNAGPTSANIYEYKIGSLEAFKN